MKRTIALMLALMLAVCGFSALAEAAEPLADGVYNAEFTTDNSMSLSTRKSTSPCFLLS